MPHTHPLYHVICHDGNESWPTLNDDGEPKTLDQALRQIADYVSDPFCTLTYTIEPERSSAPRYTLLISGPNGQGRRHSWPLVAGVGWSTVRYAYEQRTAQCPAGWPLVYTVVSA